jgi:hypothetical protein
MKDETKTARAPWWDEEIEQLGSQAAAVHGEDTVAMAVDRVIRQVTADSAAPLSPSDVKAAVKAELRRMVRPH